tara:strand:+ start:1204 stop:1437 length:234 start_codon:yes stop_codon:yes gene_type:complete
MAMPIRKIIFSIFFNSTLFLTLVIAIQNSSNKSKVNFLINKTIDLPISFIIGVSFISGSFIGNFLTSNNDFQNKKSS